MNLNFRNVSIGCLLLLLISFCIGGALVTLFPQPDHTTAQVAKTNLAPSTSIPEPPPAPANTPAPTLTLTPISPPDPIRFDGRGDTIISLDKWTGHALLRVNGNQAGHHFAITTYAPSGEMIDIPINETEPYSGLVPIDFDGEHTTRLEVKADGDWVIEVLPLSAARITNLPAKITGQGDEVIILTGADPDLATISGNRAGRHFGIKVYNESGYLIDIPVNETEPYQGQVIIPPAGRVLAVTAAGDWSIEITTR